MPAAIGRRRRDDHPLGRLVERPRRRRSPSTMHAAIVELGGVEHERARCRASTSSWIVDRADERGCRRATAAVAGRTRVGRPWQRYGSRTVRVARRRPASGSAIGEMVPAVACRLVPDRRHRPYRAASRATARSSESAGSPARFDVVGIGNALVDVIAPVDRGVPGRARSGQGIDDAHRDRARRRSCTARSARPSR